MLFLWCDVRWYCQPLECCGGTLRHRCAETARVWRSEHLLADELEVLGNVVQLVCRILLAVLDGIRELDHGEKVDLDEAIAILEERLALSNSSQ